MATAFLSTVPDFDNLMNPVNIQNPFPLYEWLRINSPVHWNKYIGSWMLTRFDDVRSAFSDFTRVSSNSGGPLLKKADDLPPSARTHFEIGYRFFYQQIQASDPPAHTAQRALIAKAFTPRVMESMRESIQIRVDRLIDRMEEFQKLRFHFAVRLSSALSCHFRPVRSSGDTLRSAQNICGCFRPLSPCPSRAEFGSTGRGCR